MVLKQISLSMPEKLFRASKEYAQEYGYKNFQEFILEVLRKRVILDRAQRYQMIEAQMKAGKNVKKFSQKDAVEFIKGL